MFTIRGTYTALVTPFHRDRVDLERLAALVEAQAEAGIEGVVPCGTTGEAPTLSRDEQAAVIRTAVIAARGRMQVIAGTGANSTSEAIERTAAAREAGADAALIVTPYYNKPTQEGLFRHFTAIADAVPLPIVLYNIPSRTAVSIEVETMARLARDSRIVAVKEASGDLRLTREVLRRTPLAVLSGDDALTLPILALGGVGVVSVASNVAPREVRSVVSSYLGGDAAAARALDRRLGALYQALFLETNPIPAKGALHLLGWIDPDVRLPLVPCSPPVLARLRDTLQDLGLLVGEPQAALAR